MKLIKVELRKNACANWDDGKGGRIPELDGFVEFEGKTGVMRLPLTQQDIIDIEQLLRIKTKVLGAEA
jgi:hypothetical protein